MITQKRLKELLKYDPDTGVFVWLKSRPGIKAGTIAGSLSKGKVYRKDGTFYFNRYRKISVDGKLYGASKLAWLYMEGYWPEHIVDHKDRIKDNDKWENLRRASRACNARNSDFSQRSNGKVLGVRRTSSGNWAAVIGNGGRAEHLGTFDLEIDAVKARWNAEVKYGYPNCQESSTAYLYLKQKNII